MIAKERISDKIKKQIEEIKQVKPRKFAESRKKIADLSYEIADYFRAKAKDRKFFY